MTTEDMQADHLALAFECNRQLMAENADYRAALESVSNMVPAGSHESFIIDTVLAKYAQPIPCPTTEQSKP